MGLVADLAVVTLGVRLPGLVEGLEVEGVDTPVEGTAAVSGVLVIAFWLWGSGFTYTASW